MENVFVKAGTCSVINVSEIRHLTTRDLEVFNPSNENQYITYGGEKPVPTRIIRQIMVYYKNINDPMSINFGDDPGSRDSAFALILEKMGVK